MQSPTHWCLKERPAHIAIADKVYEKSWNTESQLLVQASYRNELYEANDYAKAYEKLLQDSLSTQISELYSEVQNIREEKSEAISALDLSEARDLLEDAEFSASYELGLAVDAVAAATQENASDSVIQNAIADADLAVQGVETTITNLSEEINDINAEIDTLNKQVNNAYQNYRNAIAAGQDGSGFWTDIQKLQGQLSDRKTAKTEQQNDLDVCKQASRIIQQCQSELQRMTGSVGTDAMRDLQEIHASLLDRTLGRTELEEVLQTITGLFGELQSMEALSDGEGGISFTLLNQVNQMIQDIEDYTRIREDREKLDDWADQFQTTLDDQEKGEEQPRWKSVWMQSMDELRAVIGGLPVYDGDDSQILRNYDRGDAMDRMDKTIQRYITEHNPADQSVIYLMSPYRGMALFALALAFFLDIAAFITGLIVDTVETQRKKKDEQGGGEVSEVGVFGGYPVIPATRRRYVYLTGNYTKENGQYYCQAFEGMEEKEIILPESQIANGCRGFFVDASKNSFRVVAASALAFTKTQGGPRDGIYRNCIEYVRPLRR